MITPVNHLKLLLSKISFSFLIVLLIQSCKSVGFYDVKMINHFSGLNSYDNYVNYSVSMKINSDIEINSIEIENYLNKESINQFSFLNLNNYSGHKVVNYPFTLKKGTYKLTFVINKEIKLYINEFIIINYLIRNKNYRQKLKVKKVNYVNDK